MSAELFLSRFTPSMMSADVLEKVLVQRGDLADRLVEVTRESVLTPAKHHTLVIGSRGIGKTHLLSLVQNRIAGQEDLAERVRIAWLREEEWGVASFLDFLYRILRALAARYQDDALRDETETLFSLALKTAERRAADLLRSFIEGKTLLLIAENLDSVFQGLEKKGQQRLRAYLQEESSWTILASSQALFGGIALYESPFYGFFEIHHLQELTVDDAARLVQNIAELANDQALAAYVQSESGRARIRAVHHLAGGNHRVYMILSEFLTRDSLDQLVDPFLRMMDDLTPYYQARMEQLSPQQRKIIDLLCGVRGAVPVKEIAKRCFISSQTASSQLKNLRDRGYVNSTPVGRDAYYELSEPLMRLALEVKNQRNGHVRLFLDFLRHWYARPELVDLLARTPVEAPLEREYLEWALAEEDGEAETPYVRSLIADYNRLARARAWGRALPVAQKLIAERGSVADWTKLGHCLCNNNNHPEALAALDKALQLDSTYPNTWVWRSVVLLVCSRIEEALEAIDTAMSHTADNAYLYGVRGSLLHRLGRFDQALQTYDRAVELMPQLADLWDGRANVLQAMDRCEDALAASDRCLEVNPDFLNRRIGRGELLNALGRFPDALADFEHALQREPANPRALLGKSLALAGTGNRPLAIETAERAYALTPDSPVGNWILAVQMVEQKRFADALPYLQSAEELGIDSEFLRPTLIRTLLGLGDVTRAKPQLKEMLAETRGDDDLLIDYTIGLMGDLFGTISSVTGKASSLAIARSYRDYSREGVLASSLARSADWVMSPGATTDDGRRWIARWREMAGPDKTFELPLRLLDTLIIYRETGDPRVLLSLPVEERRIIQEVLERSSGARIEFEE